MASTQMIGRLFALAALLLAFAPVSEAYQNSASRRQERTCFDARHGDDRTRIIEACTAVIESGEASNGELWSALNNRGMSYFLRADPDYAQAIADLDRAVALGPSTTVLVNRGRVHTAQRNYAAAISDFDRAIATNPTNASPYYRRGIAYREQSQFDEAMRNLDRAAELSPRNFAYQYGRCRIRLMASLELDVARAACDEAIRLEPHNSPGWLLRGMVGIKQERWQDAWDDFDQVVQSKSDEATALFGRGIAAIALGRVEDGERDRARATQIRSSVSDTFAAFGVEPQSEQ